MQSIQKLPFELDALEPVISKQTMDFHYNKHYAGYINKTNELIKGTPFKNLSLKEIVEQVEGKPEYKSLYNNAGQALNHEFFWNSLTDNKKSHDIPDKLAADIQNDFGSIENFKNAFVQVAGAQFGSGWVWLVRQNGVLDILSTGNADHPTGDNIRPLLCVDVWEHAYYLDYQNRRTDFVSAVVDKLLNWQFATENDRQEE